MKQQNNNYVQVGESYFTDLQQILQSLRGLRLRIAARKNKRTTEVNGRFVVHVTTPVENIDYMIASVKNSIRDGYYIDNINFIKKG